MAGRGQAGRGQAEACPYNTVLEEKDGEKKKIRGTRGGLPYQFVSLSRNYAETRTTFCAWKPLGPLATSNSTSAPSGRLL